MNATPADDIGIGSILRETYELVSVLGKGGMGKVYLARHLRLPGKQVAVKVLHTQEEISPDQYARFRREAEITSRLGHPNIVGVLDFYGQEGGPPCLVMEHLKGESLSQRIRRGRIPLNEVMSIARQIGSALHAAHLVGVIHRDLKPGNIFLVPTESGGVVTQQVKLLDFGISKIVSSQTLQTVDDVLMGTPQYMSPEQAMGQNSTTDARSDLFALGSIVYEMLSGVSPFDDPVMMRILYRIVQEPLVPLAPLCPEVPASVCAVVEKALEKRPEDRQPSVAVFIEELTGSPLRTLAEAELEFTHDLPAPVSGRASAPPPGPTKVGRASRSSEAPASVPPASVPPAAAPGGALASAPPAAPELARPARARRAVAIAASLVAMLGVGVAMRGLRQDAPPVEPSLSPAAPAAVVARPVPPPAAPTPLPVADAPAVAAAPEPKKSASVEPEPQASEPVAARPVARPAARVEVEALPADVRADLDQAERALAANQVEEALRIIRRSQRKSVTGASFSLLTRAHCQQKDLANARAQWGKVPAADRTKVRQFCKDQGISF